MSNYQEVEYTNTALQNAYKAYQKKGISLSKLVFYVPLPRSTATPINHIYAYDIEVLKNNTADALKKAEDVLAGTILNLKASPAMTKCIIYHKPVWWQQIAQHLGILKPQNDIYLDVTIEDCKGKRTKRIAGPITSIGASKEADLQLFIDAKQERYVSKLHAQIAYSPAQQLWYIVNTSLNKSGSKPIFVDGNIEKINSEKAYTMLRNGSVIQFGKADTNTSIYPKITIIAFTNETRVDPDLVIAKNNPTNK